MYPKRTQPPRPVECDAEVHGEDNPFCRCGDFVPTSPKMQQLRADFLARQAKTENAAPPGESKG